MKKPFALISGIVAAFALPLISLAAINNISDAGSFIINTINNIIVPTLFALAFIVFIFGVFRTFIVGANDEDAKKAGKNLMLYGFIGFVVMLSVWGIVNMLTGTVSFGNNSGINGGTPKAGVQIGG